MLDQYIGVTGVTDQEQVERMLTVFPEFSPIKLMIGVLASWKSLRGIPLNPYWQQQTPPINQIQNIFIVDPRVINLVHFSSDDNSADLFEDLRAVTDHIGSAQFDGFQLNITAPNLEALRQYKKYYPRHQFVLQINQRWLDRTDNRLMTLIGDLEKYVNHGVANGLLFDLSGGRGKPFNPVEVFRFLFAVTNLGWPVRLGVAGGLGSNDSLHDVANLVENFPRLSIDAQSHLRNQQNELDLKLTMLYLQRSLEIFAKPQEGSSV